MAKSNTHHYHVTVGFPGYLPNSNYPCRTLAEAYAIAQNEKDAFLDYGWDDDKQTIRVRGSIRRDRQYIVWRRSETQTTIEWDPWQYIEIAECDEPSCWDDDGELYSE